MMGNLSSSVPQTPTLLLVEDSNEDFEVFKRLLGRASLSISIQRCVTGDQALSFLCRTENSKEPLPGLIVLDLNLPGTDGREVLHRIKQDEELRKIPVIVFTTSNNPQDIEVCYRYGVNSYVIKPINFVQLKKEIQTIVQTIVHYWFEVSTLPDPQEKLP